MIKHPTDGGTACDGFLRDTIKGHASPREGRKRIEFKSGYQGEIDYIDWRGRRLTFRCSKNAFNVPWSPNYWNYPDEETFERQHNGNWGMLTEGNEPVDAETLEVFRRESFPSAVTGYYCHHTHGWVECEPTKEKPGRKSWVDSGAEARCMKELNGA